MDEHERREQERGRSIWLVKCGCGQGGMVWDGETRQFRCQECSKEFTPIVTGTACCGRCKSTSTFLDVYQGDAIRCWHCGEKVKKVKDN